jgi:hypothetical protein
MSPQDPGPDGLDHAFDAVHRGGERVHRRFHWRHRGTPSAFVGLVLVSLGVLFLLDNLNIIETRDFIGTFWRLLLVGWGLARIASGRGGERILGAAAVFAGGILLGNQLFDWDINPIAVFWPLLLIGFGLNVLSKAWGRKPPHGEPPAGVPRSAPAADGTAEPAASVDTSSTIKEFAVMAGVERRNVSQTFRGGDVTAVMGSVEIDLRDCRMAENQVDITVFVTLGSVVFRIPRDWAVESRVTAVLASFEDRSEPPVAAASKRFVVLGSAFLGNVEIRN